MAKEPELAIVAKLTRRAGTHGVLTHPHGPEAAAIIKELVEALENAAVELEDAADWFEAVKMKTCAACAAKASTEARATLTRAGANR